MQEDRNRQEDTSLNTYSTEHWLVLLVSMLKSHVTLVTDRWGLPHHKSKVPMTQISCHTCYGPMGLAASRLPHHKSKVPLNHESATDSVTPGAIMPLIDNCDQ
jgi:hypothetical protein